MIQEKRVERAEPDVRDFAVLRIHSQQKRQRIAPYLREASDQQPSPRPRWKHTQILPCPRDVERRY
jgi:hypothetical protein